MTRICINCSHPVSNESLLWSMWTNSELSQLQNPLLKANYLLSRMWEACGAYG